MSRRFAVQSVAVLLTLVAVLAVVATPLGASIPTAEHGAIVPHVGPSRGAGELTRPTTTDAAPAVARPAGSQTIGGRAFETSESPVTGDQQDSALAIDNATGTVFALSYDSPVLTAFNAFTGLEERTLVFSNGSLNWFAESLAYDNVTNQLFVGWDGNSSDSGWLTILNATTFATLGALSFATSWMPDFYPGQMLVIPSTNTLYIENASTNDVMVLNASNDSFATFVPISCSSPTEYGYCSSYFPMFYAVAGGTPFVVVPQGAANTSGVSIDPNASQDVIVGGYADPQPDSYLGAGTYNPYLETVYFANATDDGTILLFDSIGTFLGSTLDSPIAVTQLSLDLTDGWLVETGYNFTANVGAQITGLSPFNGTVAWQNETGTEFANDYIYNFVFATLPNGTTYAVTAGGDSGGSNLLIQLPTNSLTLSYEPFTIVHYSATPIPDDEVQPVADAATGDVYWLNEAGYAVTAQSESTGATVWNWPIPATADAETLTVDAADSVVYVSAALGGGGQVYAVSATTGLVELNLTLPFVPYGISSGENHLLYLADETNSTIQVYTNGGSASTLTWSATLTVPTASNPCELAASPVAEVVAVVACSLGETVEIASVAAHGVIGYYNETSVDWWQLAFNATGALFIGSTNTNNISVIAAGTWDFVENLTAPFDVFSFGFLPQLDALAVSSNAYEAVNGTGVAVLSVANGHDLGTFTPSSPVVSVGTDGTTGDVVALLTTGQTFWATLVALPGTASGLALTAGNTTLSASWSASVGASGYPVTGYSVLSSSAANGPWTDITSVSATTATLTGLTDGTTYYVTVRATSGSGTSAIATPASGVPVGVPYPPIALTAGAATSSSLAFSWSAPASNEGAAVTSYTLDYATSASGPWTPVTQGGALSGTLTGLSSGTKYFVEVDATNSVGVGHASAAVTASTSSSSTGSSGLPGGSTLILGVAVLVVVVVALLVVGLVMMRRRGGGSGSPPAGASGGASGPTAPPPPPSS
jgi:hypothetical protein